MATIEAYYLIPFWVGVLICLRFFVSTYTAIFIASVLFGAVELTKARKTQDTIWQSLTKDITIIGHRGCALNAPENTLAAVREAHRLGLKAIEFDIMLTLDNQPAVIHDSSVDRTTDKTGEIGMMTWQEVQKLDASCRYTGPGSFSQERVPHLREMLRECKKYGLKAFLDVKGSQPIIMSNILADMVKEFPDLHEWAVVCSFYPQALLAVKWYLPHFTTILTHRPWLLTLQNPDGPERNEELWKRIAAPIADFLQELSVYHFWWYYCGANGFFMQEEVMSVGEVKYWKKRGVDAFIWTVNDSARKDYLRYLNIPYLTDDCRS